MQELFERRYGRRCEVLARAPGRVNLIGEHTDYNDGYVLPLALEHCTWVAAARREDAHVHVDAVDLGVQESWPIDRWRDAKKPHWTSYIAGVAAILQERGAALGGVDLVVRSDVPLGSGLSSSAALEVATAVALCELSGMRLSDTELADVAREAEHRFAGVPCGIMDQYISVLGRQDAALLLDCRSQEFEQIPLQLGRHTVLIVNSGVKHELAGGEYAKRQKQCQAAVAYFRGVDANVRSLRDVTPAMVEEHFSKMDPLPARRARHVVTEIVRTLDAAEALRRGELDDLGPLLAGSHASLRDDYEVSCTELDLLVDIVSDVPGVIGARMTGGGFGGCIVALALAECVPQIQEVLVDRYDQQTGIKSTLIQTRAGAGAAVEASHVD
jgi:galactokinase